MEKIASNFMPLHFQCEVEGKTVPRIQSYGTQIDIDEFNDCFKKNTLNSAIKP